MPQTLSFNQSNPPSWPQSPAQGDIFVVVISPSGQLSAVTYQYQVSGWAHIKTNPLYVVPAAQTNPIYSGPESKRTTQEYFLGR